jgi:hypothetical protein
MTKMAILFFCYLFAESTDDDLDESSGRARGGGGSEACGRAKTLSGVSPC